MLYMSISCAYASDEHKDVKGQVSPSSPSREAGEGWGGGVAHPHRSARVASPQPSSGDLIYLYG